MAIENLAGRADLLPGFLGLPSRLYAVDRRWIPTDERPLRAALSDALRPRADGGQPRSAHFVARVGGRTAARISAFVNPALRDQDGERVGALGYFEAEEDAPLVGDLIAHARSWLKTAHGISRIWGPLNRDIWHGYRCMTEGHDADPFVGEPYNFAYYPELLERSGALVRFRWNSFESVDRQSALAAYRRGEAQRANLLEHGYRFAALDRTLLYAEARKLHQLIARSFSRFPAYSPIGQGDFWQLFASLASALAPGGAWFLQDPAGACCGFAIALADVGAALKAARRGSGPYPGEKVPSEPQRALFHLIGVTPEAAAQCPGVGRALVTQVLGALIAHGFERYVAALICRGNTSRGLTGAPASTIRRGYALYEWRS